MEADPKWFQTRPSAVDYDPGSSASNLGPNNADLIAAIKERKKAVAALDGSTRPRSRRTRSPPAASGLDPHISPAYAAQQVDRVARERGLDVGQVSELVDGPHPGPDPRLPRRARVNVVDAEPRARPR